MQGVAELERRVGELTREVGEPRHAVERLRPEKGALGSATAQQLASRVALFLEPVRVDQPNPAIFMREFAGGHCAWRHCYGNFDPTPAVFPHTDIIIPHSQPTLKRSE